MKKILALIKFDITNAIRDSLIIYLLVAPILLAGGLRVFLPNIEASVITIALEVPDQGTDQERAMHMADSLSRFARVETFSGSEAVRNRVMDTDDVGGIVLSEQGWHILLEGNENQESESVMRSILDVAARDGFIGEYQVSEPSKPSLLGPYAAVILVMMAALIGGLAVAFAMIDEKEQGIHRAFAISPLRPWQYFTARGGLSFGLGIAVALAGHLILLGGSVSLGRFSIALLSSAAMPLAIALLVGGIAKNQIQAIAVLKVVMLVYLTVPMVTIFISPQWHPIFYVFPNYWMFRSFEDLYLGFRGDSGFWISVGINAVMGCITLAVLGLTIGRKLRPR
ncbi:MAG: ABC transporter permease [Spirochaeta sp.]